MEFPMMNLLGVALGISLLSGSAMSEHPSSHEVILEELRFLSWEPKSFFIPGRMDGEGYEIEIKGIVSRPEAVLDMDDRRFVDLATLVAQVRSDYCRLLYVPAGVATFNAGRNVTAVVGNYVPDKLRIEIKYRPVVESGGPLRSSRITCEESLREATP